jgi:hypothetical protein
MSKVTKCDICEKLAESFISNTTKNVVLKNKTHIINVTVSLQSDGQDICSTCFNAALRALAKAIKTELGGAAV